VKSAQQAKITTSGSVAILLTGLTMMGVPAGWNSLTDTYGCFSVDVAFLLRIA
jgi:hypothetical protein